MTRDLNVLIGNLGNIDNLRACLRSLFDTTGPNISFRVMIGFNFAGENDTPLAIKQEFPQVEMLRADCKLGYCRLYNLLLEKGLDARYVLLLDDDTLLRRGTIETMVRFMDDHTEVGVAGCRTVNQDGSYQKSTGLMYNLKTELLNVILPAAFWSDGIDENVSDSRLVGWLNGHFLIARVKAIQEIGLLDDYYYTFQYEADWSLRMRQAGWATTYVPQAEIMHIGGPHSIVSRNKSYDNLIRSNVNRYYFFRKHYSAVDFLVLRAALGLGFLFRLLHYLGIWVLDRNRRSEAQPKIKAYFYLTLRTFAAHPEQLPQKLLQQNTVPASFTAPCST